jgi:hypothetical protein
LRVHSPHKRHDPAAASWGALPLMPSDSSPSIVLKIEIACFNAKFQNPNVKGMSKIKKKNFIILPLDLICHLGFDI